MILLQVSMTVWKPTLCVTLVTRFDLTLQYKHNKPQRYLSRHSFDDIMLKDKLNNI